LEQQAEEEKMSQSINDNDLPSTKSVNGQGAKSASPQASSQASSQVMPQTKPQIMPQTKPQIMPQVDCCCAPQHEADFFFQNTACEYFPCHNNVPVDQFNCMFCYCPLYALGDECGGEIRYADKGIKDCSACTKNHEGVAGGVWVVEQSTRVVKITAR